jgi:hypothetical protein
VAWAGSRGQSCLVSGRDIVNSCFLTGTGLAQGWRSRGLCEGLDQMQSLSKFLLPAVVPENKCSSPPLTFADLNSRWRCNKEQNLTNPKQDTPGKEKKITFCKL